MKAPGLKPIPVPPRRRWREFRLVRLPVLTFVGLTVMIGWMWVRFVQPSSFIGEIQTGRTNVLRVVEGSLQDDRLDSVAILVVGAGKSARVMAWVRPPVTVRPLVGDVVRVRRATLGQPEFEATVIKVGRQLEEINPTAVPLSATLQRAELGLPLIVQTDGTLELIPGEAVQIRILRHAADVN